jgi:hypothetical protein
MADISEAELSKAEYFKAELFTQAQPVEPPNAQTTPPKAAPPTETATWQTKALVARKMGGRRPYAMKQVDILAPVSAAPPGLGPPNPARLLAPEMSSHSINEGLEEGPVPILSGNLTDTLKEASETVATTGVIANGSFLGPAPGSTPERPYTQYETTRNADTESTTVFEHIENRSGHASEPLAEDPGAGCGRKVARRSAIKKVQPAQFESKVLYMLILSIALTLRQMSNQATIRGRLTPTTRLKLPTLALPQQSTRTSNLLISVIFNTGSSTLRCSRKRRPTSSGRLCQLKRSQ